MACSCINGVYDFDLHLAEGNCKTITYIDRSVWMVGPDYPKVPSYTFTVTDSEGNSKEFTHTVGIPTVLDLGDCVSPDVYTFSVSTCIDNYTKAKPILCSLWCGYLRAVKKRDSVTVQDLRDIRERIEYIEQLVSYGDIMSARQLVQIVSRNLRRINCNCGC